MSLTPRDFLGVAVIVYPCTHAPVGALKELGASLARWLHQVAGRDGFRVDPCGLEHVRARVESLLAGELPDPVGLALACAARAAWPGGAFSGLTLAELARSPFLRERHVSFQVEDAIHRLPALRASLCGCLYTPAVERVVFRFLRPADLDNVEFAEISWAA